MEEKQVVSPSDPRTEKKGSGFGTILVLGAIIGAGTWIYNDRSEKELQVMADCMGEIAQGPADDLAIDSYLGIARRSCSMLSREDTQDIVMVTLLNVCTKEPDKRRNVRQYFIRSLRNGAISWCRKHGSFSYDDTLPHTREADDSAATFLQKEAVAEAMKKLSPTDRKLLQWHAVEGASYIDIAKRLGVKSPKTARERVREAVEKLRDEYSDMMP